jgi:hypothetical protein
MSAADDVSAAIAGQVGASGGLWTHTPLDWRENEFESALEQPADKPVDWPSDASIAVPPNGSRAGVPVPPALQLPG